MNSIRTATSPALAVLLVSCALAGAACREGGTEPGERSEVVAETAQAPDAQGERPGFLSRLFTREPIEVQVPAGTQIAVRLLEPVSSQASRPGEVFQAEVAQDVVVGGQTALPAGAHVTGTVTEAQALRKIGGRARLALSFDAVELPSGGSAPLNAAFAQVGKSETPKDAATIAGGAVAGAILGHQVDDDDEGKVVGGLVGAGVGSAIATKTRGQEIVLPAGTTLTLTLRSPTTVELPG
jgi:hypothetical protein